MPCTVILKKEVYGASRFPDVILNLILLKNCTAVSEQMVLHGEGRAKRVNSHNEVS